MAIGSLDLAVLCIYTATAVLLGVWVGRGKQDLAGYLLGGRDLPWWAILGSVVATETSTATFLSVPGVAFAKTTGDLTFLQLTFGYILGRTLIVYTLLPLYFKGQLFTAYQVLEERFGGATKQTASLIFLVTRNLGDGLRLFLAAIALQEVLGWGLPTCVVIMGTATIVYTVFGGMKSVIWNDCLQMVIYLVGGALAASVILSRLPNGWETLQTFGAEEGKFRILDWSFVLKNPYTIWAGVIGGMFLTLGTHGTDQMMVQRYLCARSQAQAGRALIASGFVVLLQFAMFLMLGVGLACFYELEYPGRTFERGDRVFATFIVEEMPQNVGLIGLLLAAVFASAMSTLSSSLNSSASAVVNDFLGAAKAPSADSGGRSEKESTAKLVATSRFLTVVFGLVQIGIGIAAQHFSQSVVGDALAIAGFSSGLLLGVFALGVGTKRVGQSQCLIGMLFGLGCLLSVKFVLPNLPEPVVIAWPWYAMIGSIATFSGGLIASLLMGPREPATTTED